MLVALNVGALVGVKSEHMVRLIKDYALLPNRIEYVSTINGKNFYNDSKGTNIHACRFAIESMDGTVGLIMGGSDKNEDFCDFFENINPKVKFVAITGGNAEKIRNSALKMGFTDICVLPALEDAVKFLAKKDGVSNVLLSPCCASFDRYRNYAERGDKFREAVYAIEL
jgi:UDP-N-acetylmuramoylalanine--D-glutamate ligase